MKKKMLNLIIALVFLTGISLMLYPAVSDYWNSFHRSGVIADYNGQVKKLDKADYDKILSDAKEYNKSLVGKDNRYKLSESEQKEYENLLNISGDGMMGYVEISGIQCTLPIYHGIDEEILQVAVGHLPELLSR